MGAVTAAVIGGAAAVSAARTDSKSAKSSVRSQEGQVAASRDFIEKSMKQARQDLFKLFPSAQRSRQAGIQASMNLFNESIPMQMEAFQGGNVAAQDQLTQGLGQFQNAIMGNPVDTNFQSYNPEIQGIQAGPAPTPEPIAGMQQQPLRIGNINQDILAAYGRRY